MTSDSLVNASIATHSRIFPHASFHADVRNYLLQQLSVNDPSSMLKTKELMAGPLRDKRLHAVNVSMDALSERFVEGVPQRRIAKRAGELAGGSKGKAKI